MKNCLRFKFLTIILTFLAFGALLSGCGSSGADYDTALADAQLALDEGDAGRSSRICSELLDKNARAWNFPK